MDVIGERPNTCPTSYPSFCCRGCQLRLQIPKLDLPWYLGNLGCPIPIPIPHTHIAAAVGGLFQAKSEVAFAVFAGAEGGLFQAKGEGPLAAAAVLDFLEDLMTGGGENFGERG